MGNSSTVKGKKNTIVVLPILGTDNVCMCQFYSNCLDQSFYKNKNGGLTEILCFSEGKKKNDPNIYVHGEIKKTEKDEKKMPPATWSESVTRAASCS